MVTQTQPSAKSAPQQTKPPVIPGPKADALTILFTGNELGALKPCGCSGGQLGGFDRRAAVLNTAPKDKRLIIDTGGFIETDSEQDFIKFDIIVQALSLLKYDLVNLTRKDIETAAGLGLLDGIGSLLNVITAQPPNGAELPAKFTRVLPIKGRLTAVSIAAFDAESNPVEQIGALFAPHPLARPLNILILNKCDPSDIDSIGKNFPAVDCLICPCEYDEPRLISNPNETPLVFSVGRYGRYVCRLQAESVEGKDKLKLSFDAIPVQETLAQDKSLVQLYKVYQKLLGQAGLLEKYPRFTLPDGLKYTGSASCKTCHEFEYEQWSLKVHAYAFGTLEAVGSDVDPECVLCHVVAMKYESGFVSIEKTPQLKGVGCENCHGPGSEHIETLGQAKTTEPRSTCIDCHDPEHSTNYAGNEKRFLLDIVHWSLTDDPNDSGETAER